jgi:hypothetical protein
MSNDYDKLYVDETILQHLLDLLQKQPPQDSQAIMRIFQQVLDQTKTTRSTTRDEL